MISTSYFRKRAALTITYLILYTLLGVYIQVAKAGSHTVFSINAKTLKMNKPDGNDHYPYRGYPDFYKLSHPLFVTATV